MKLTNEQIATATGLSAAEIARALATATRLIRYAHSANLIAYGDRRISHTMLERILNPDMALYAISCPTNRFFTTPH